jgi:hypothetical protein
MQKLRVRLLGIVGAPLWFSRDDASMKATKGPSSSPAMPDYDAAV